MKGVNTMSDSDCKLKQVNDGKCQGNCSLNNGKCNGNKK
jgi:hypothetical protein